MTVMTFLILAAFLQICYSQRRLQANKSRTCWTFGINNPAMPVKQKPYKVTSLALFA
jgi:hypothetical protein